MKKQHINARQRQNKPQNSNFVSSRVPKLLAACMVAFTVYTIRSKAMDTTQQPDYTDDFCWVSKPEAINKSVDVFYVYPTIYAGTNASNMDISDPALRENAQGLMVAQAGVYSPYANLFAPFYRQQTAAEQSMDAANGGVDAFQDPHFQIGAGDIERAFDYYLKHLNPD